MHPKAIARARAANHVGALYCTELGDWEFQVYDAGKPTRFVSRRLYFTAFLARQAVIREFQRRYEES